MPKELQKIILHKNNEDFRKQIGGNDLCTCGSGRKYKKCCGK